MAFWDKRGRQDSVEVYHDERYPDEVFVADASSDTVRDIAACTAEWDNDGHAYIPSYVRGSDRIVVKTRRHGA